MRTTTKLAGFGLGLVAVLGAGAGVGAVAGPDIPTVEAEVPPPFGEGVVAADEGYRLLPLSRELAPGGGPFRFTVADQNGAPVREYTAIHERDLHLIMVSRELTSFHHVHPALGADGTWAIDLPALAAGSYRAIADFQVADGPRLALGTDLTVAGVYRPVEPSGPTARSAVDGYDVTLETTPGKGGEVTATLTVRRDGGPVPDLQPYLGAKGHLVALRSGDLAYAHVHPVEDEDEEPGVVRFDAELTSAGRYGLFFDFKHGDRVHTATFTFDQGAVTGEPDMEMGS